MPQKQNETTSRIFLLIILSIFTTLYWYVIANILLGEYSLFSKVIFGSIVSWFFISIVCLLYLVPKFKLYIFIYSVIFSGAAALFLSFPWWGYVLLIPFAIGLLILSYSSIHKNLSTRLKFSVSVINGAYSWMALIIVSFLVLGIFNYYINDNNRKEIDISTYVNDAFFDKVLESFMPGYEEGITVDDYIKNTTDNFSDEITIYGAEQLSEEDKQEMINGAIQDQLEANRLDLGDTFDLNLAGNESLRSIIINFINKKINEAINKNEFIYALVLAGLTLFITTTIKSLLLPLIYLLVSSLLKVFIKLNIYKIHTQKVDKEVIVF